MQSTALNVSNEIKLRESTILHHIRITPCLRSYCSLTRSNDSPWSCCAASTYWIVTSKQTENYVKYACAVKFIAQLANQRVESQGSQAVPRFIPQIKHRFALFVVECGCTSKRMCLSFPAVSLIVPLFYKLNETLFPPCQLSKNLLEYENKRTK
jgi:hypothetical protein